MTTCWLDSRQQLTFPGQILAVADPVSCIGTLTIAVRPSTAVTSISQVSADTASRTTVISEAPPASEMDGVWMLQGPERTRAEASVLLPSLLRICMWGGGPGSSWPGHTSGVSQPPRARTRKTAHAGAIRVIKAAGSEHPMPASARATLAATLDRVAGPRESRFSASGAAAMRTAGGGPAGVDRAPGFVQVDDHRRVIGRDRFSLSRLAIDLGPPPSRLDDRSASTSR